MARPLCTLLVSCCCHQQNANRRQSSWRWQRRRRTERRAERERENDMNLSSGKWFSQMFFFVVSIHLLFIVNANSEHLCIYTKCSPKNKSQLYNKCTNSRTNWKKSSPPPSLFRCHNYLCALVFIFHFISSSVQCSIVVLWQQSAPRTQ